MTTHFDFPREMVYGKKHLNKLSNDDLNHCKFVQLVEQLFGCELNMLHLVKENEYSLFTEIGKDTDTEFHRKFYEKLNSNWDEIYAEYDSLIKNVVLPYLGLSEALVQRFPTFRVKLPDNVASSTKHYDSDPLHKHPTGEVNFIYALTDMYDSNSLNVEKMPRLEQYETLDLKAGECISFNGNKCTHFNEINQTGKTRLSLDFRILPFNYFDASYEVCSATKQSKFDETGYYKRISL